MTGRKENDQRGYLYIDQPRQLRELRRRLGDAQRVAVDTEANSLYRYHERVCLLQVGINGSNFLIDTLADLDFTPVLNTLARKPLLLHGADYDLRMLRHSFGFRPQVPLFDTMLAAQLLGYERLGLAALVEQFFGVTLNKGSQKADWTLRPLPDRTLRYAADDTRYLPGLVDRLTEELRQRGRLDWHRESCERMVEATAVDTPRDPEREWRTRGAGRLSRRELAFLRELWRWRDAAARQADRPPFKIMGDRQLTELARWGAAKSDGSLSGCPRLPRTLRGGRRRALERALRQAYSLSPAKYPDRRPPQRAPRRPGFDGELLAALQAECERVANTLDLPRQLLAPRAALENVARARPADLAGLMTAGPLMRWQAKLLAPGVEAVLAKRND